MARSILVDSGYLVALLSRRDAFHRWAAAQPERFPPPWATCEAVLSETFHLLGRAGAAILTTLLERRALVPGFDLGDEMEPVLKLLRKYADVPMSLADACLVRMSETRPDPVILSTDADFCVYRRHSRQVLPCVLPFLRAWRWAAQVAGDLASLNCDAPGTGAKLPGHGWRLVAELSDVRSRHRSSGD